MTLAFKAFYVSCTEAIGGELQLVEFDTLPENAEIRSLTLNRDRLVVRLDCDLDVEVTFRLKERKYVRREFFLRRIVDGRLWLGAHASKPDAPPAS